MGNSMHLCLITNQKQETKDWWNSTEGKVKYCLKFKWDYIATFIILRIWLVDPHMIPIHQMVECKRERIMAKTWRRCHEKSIPQHCYDIIKHSDWSKLAPCLSSCNIQSECFISLWYLHFAVIFFVYDIGSSLKMGLSPQGHFALSVTSVKINLMPLISQDEDSFWAQIARIKTILQTSFLYIPTTKVSKGKINFTYLCTYVPTLKFNQIKIMQVFGAI